VETVKRLALDVGQVNNQLAQDRATVNESRSCRNAGFRKTLLLVRIDYFRSKHQTARQTFLPVQKMQTANMTVGVSLPARGAKRSGEQARL
jgi:hypothetical protein